jgi:2-aminoethylphosphonate-pyruvate transaminase
VALWALFADDLSLDELEALAPGLAVARADGARIALVTHEYVAQPSVAASPRRSSSVLEGERAEGRRTEAQQTDVPGSDMSVGKGGDAASTQWRGNPPSQERSPALQGLADIIVTGPAAPSPFGLFSALQAAQISDVRSLGVLAASPASLEAGHRAGAGAIVGLAAQDADARLPLLEAQPDVIVAPEQFEALDSERYSSQRAHRQRVLLNPGPAVVTDRVHRAVGGPDLCHREPEYSEIFDRVRRKLLKVAGVADDWALVMLAGSGTAAMEAMTISSTRPGRKLLVCRNGIYGERIETIARRAGIDVVIVEASNLEPIDPAAVATVLDADPAIDAVAVVHHETTTGLLNPVREIAAAAKEHGAVVAVDAISSFGAEDLDLDGIDFMASTSNKCLHGLPGIALVLVSPRGQQRIAEVPPRSLYFDLGNYLVAQARRSVPFTPSIPALYGLDVALDELLDESLEHRKVYYRARADYLDRELARLGLEPRVAAPHRSHSVRSLPLPPGIDYDTLHDTVKEDGYIIYAGLGDAARTSFRVCALGALKIEALEGFMASLEHQLMQGGRGRSLVPTPSRRGSAALDRTAG